VLVFGESEIRFIEGLEVSARTAVLRRVLAQGVPCIVVAEGLDVGAELMVEAERAGVPLLRTTDRTPVAIAHLASLLELHLAPRDITHGVLLDVLGLGVLVTGESGIGKSECALDLVTRGCRLVADDTVEIFRGAGGVLMGCCPALTRHHMELRGLGVINVRDLFGVASTRRSKRVELIVQLERWEAGRAYERLGLDDVFLEVLGVRIPLVRMPVAPGRNLAMLVEVAARNQLLRARGRHAARDLAARVNRQLLGKAVQESAENGPAADGHEPGEEA
jgi:HPr kinase/phosphorylase